MHLARVNVELYFRATIISNRQSFEFEIRFETILKYDLILCINLIRSSHDSNSYQGISFFASIAV